MFTDHTNVLAIWEKPHKLHGHLSPHSPVLQGHPHRPAGSLWKQTDLTLGLLIFINLSHQDMTRSRTQPQPVKSVAQEHVHPSYENRQRKGLAFCSSKLISNLRLQYRRIGGKTF